MRQCLQLLLQFFLFTGNQMSIRQLFQLETDIILFLAVLISLLRQIFQLPFQREITLVFFTIQDQKDFVFRHYIDYLHLEAIISEQQVLMLRMYIDQSASQFLHDGKRHR